MVYASEVQGKKLTFQVSGMLWQRSLVMRDLETGSLWSHILGECMRGELEGEELELIPAEMTTWKQWRADHPDTTILDMSPTAKRFDSEFYRDPAKFVYGVKVAGQPKAYPFPYLEKHPVVQETIAEVPVLVAFEKESSSTVIFDPGELRFADQLRDGKLIEKKTGSRFDPSTGICTSGSLEGDALKKLDGIISYRRAWQEFYPASKIAGTK